MNATKTGLFGLIVAMLFLGGCALYAAPYGHGGVVIGPPVVFAPPVVVAPARPWWGWSGRYRGSWHR